MNLQFVDKNNKPLKAGDYISFDGSKPELLYECDMGYNIGVGLGVNASRHYVGSELYPLTEFPYELTPEGKIRMLTGEKFLIAVKRSKNMKAILMSIRPQHLVNILNGKKTIELRKCFPLNFRGWVYLYCTKAIKGKPTLIRSAFNHSYWLGTCYVDGFQINLSGKVVCRFWVDKVNTYYVVGNMIWLFNAENNHVGTGNKIEQDILDKSCVSLEDFKKYAKPINPLQKRVFAIHISTLKIFDKPKELAEFYYYKKRLIYGGMDCPPYFDEVKTQVRKAPQSWQYIYIEEDK